MVDSLRRWLLLGGPLLAIVVAMVVHLGGLPPKASICAGAATLCALWWIFECMPIAVVGLIPLVVFPTTGILTETEVAAAYGHPMILLLMAGFFLSAAMEGVGAHRRVALTMVHLVGGASGRRLVLAFMLATGGLSMWISNTAATLMMVPIALAVLSQSDAPHLRVPLLLGIAYSASIGGMSTPIGTPPNLIFMGQIEALFDIRVGFGQWMKVAMPIVVVLIPLVWWWVTRGLQSGPRLHVPHPGPWRTSEIRVLGVLAITALAWIFRTGPYGGWSSWVPWVGEDGEPLIGDTTVAIAAAIFLFVCPAGDPPEDELPEDGPPADEPPTDDRLADGASAAVATPRRPRDTVVPSRPAVISPRLLEWPRAARIHWGILLMFGGGVALARGFQASGLSAAIGAQLQIFQGAPPLLIILAVCLLITFLTEITSSTATSSLMLPILAGLAVATEMTPESVMIAGTISASCAFMLPVATAPNVIVFASGGIRTDEMARRGLALNLIAAIVITLNCWWFLA